MTSKLSILIVDDDQSMTETLKDIFHLKGYKAVAAFSGKEAMEKIKKVRFDCILTDIKMPQMNGVDLCRTVKQIQPDIPVVMMTAYAHDRLVKEGLDEGAVDVLQKPLDIDKFLRFVSTLIIKEESHGR